MCPALSSSTRSMAPAMCLRELPFICEFDKDPKPKGPGFPGMPEGMRGTMRPPRRSRSQRVKEEM
jgi:hypothetical protein